MIQQFTFYPPTDFPIGERNLLWCVDYGVLELWTNGDFVARYKYNESRNLYELDMAPQPVEPDLTDLKKGMIKTERFERSNNNILIKIEDQFPAMLIDDQVANKISIKSEDLSPAMLVDNQFHRFAQPKESKED